MSNESDSTVKQTKETNTVILLNFTKKEKVLQIVSRLPIKSRNSTMQYMNKNNTFTHTYHSFIAPISLCMDTFYIILNNCFIYRKHVLCFYQVIETRVDVWENKKCCGNMSRR